MGCHFLLQCMKVKSLSHVRLVATAWTAAYQAPLSMGFSRQEYWSGAPLPSLAKQLSLGLLEMMMSPHVITGWGFEVGSLQERMNACCSNSQGDKQFLFFPTTGQQAKIFIIQESLAAKGETIWLSFGHWDVNTSSWARSLEKLFKFQNQS